MRTAWAVQGVGYIILGIILFLSLQKDTSTSSQEYSNEASIMNNDSLIIRSPAFKTGQPIPSKYTCDGEDMSPPLAIDQIPSDTASLVLIVEDPDAPNGTWNHWIRFNIPPNTSRIGEGEQSFGVGGLNSWGTTTYGGPCPPSGEHRYYFYVYALNSTLRLNEQATKADIEEAMKGHILTSAELLGTYTRQ